MDTFADHVTDSFGTTPGDQREEGEAMLVEENSSMPGTSILTEELPSEAYDEEEAILAMEKAINQYRQKMEPESRNSQTRADNFLQWFKTRM